MKHEMSWLSSNLGCLVSVTKMGLESGDVPVMVELLRDVISDFEDGVDLAGDVTIMDCKEGSVWFLNVDWSQSGSSMEEPVVLDFDFVGEVEISLLAWYKCTWWG
jgi:hypothetical protein